MIFTKDISEWRVKVVGSQSCVRLGISVANLPRNRHHGASNSGAGSIEVATQCSDRVSSLVEYERRLNSWYGEGRHIF